MKLWISVFLLLIVSCWSYSDPSQATFEKIYRNALSASERKDVKDDLSRIIVSFQSSNSAIPLYYLSISQIYYRLGDTEKAFNEVKKEQNLLGKMALGALLVITGKKSDGYRVLSDLAHIYYTRIMQERNNQKAKLRLASNLVIVSKIAGVDDTNGFLSLLVNNGALLQDDVVSARDYVSLDRNQILTTMWPQPLH